MWVPTYFERNPHPYKIGLSGNLDTLHFKHLILQYNLQITFSRILKYYPISNDILMFKSPPLFTKKIKFPPIVTI